MTTPDALRMPFSRRWENHEPIEANINPYLADERQEPRYLGGCDVLYFAMVNEAPDGGTVVDHGSREVALLLEQAAGWLRMHTELDCARPEHPAPRRGRPDATPDGGGVVTARRQPFLTTCQITTKAGVMDLSDSRPLDPTIWKANG